MLLSRSDQWHAVTASFLGWTLDAFDFFVLVFLFDTLSVQFHVSKEQIIFTTFATLAMRPVGAVVFGLLADRYGRRKPLMANVIFFSLIELFCGFAPNYTVFLILRTIYGVDDINERWGVFTVGSARSFGGAKMVMDRIAFGGVKELEEFTLQQNSGL